MIRRPPRSTQSRSSAASDVYKRQEPLVGLVDCEKEPSGVVRWGLLIADQLDGAAAAAGLTGQVRGPRGMIAHSAQARSESWHVAAEAPDPLAIPLTQGP